jgi:hypothetical protein
VIPPRTHGGNTKRGRRRTTSICCNENRSGDTSIGIPRPEERVDQLGNGGTGEWHGTGN